jgi:hypothetical protein
MLVEYDILRTKGQQVVADGLGHCKLAIRRRHVVHVVGVGLRGNATVFDKAIDDGAHGWLLALQGGRT